ncbi:MAG: cellulase family glycosylhydrolase [Bacteroidales bacterium]|nr:cellulase family glycosylhydrolase [Bacteroidales bacterium]
MTKKTGILLGLKSKIISKEHKMKTIFKIKQSVLFISIAFLFFGWFSPDSEVIAEVNNQADTSLAFTRKKKIGRGINFGNALEAPREGEWGLVIKESYIQAIADAGFNSVRLPICWSAHMSRSYPFNIETTFLQRVDEIMNWCLVRNLAVIITIHHFNELYEHPDDQLYLSMFFAIWKQLTDHYLSVDHERLFFEVLNEPEVNLTPDKWNQLMPKIIDTIRVKDNDRTLIIDAPDYGSHQSLVKLNIPQSEQNVIVSTRYYLPYQFAQQGAWWSTWTDLNQFLGTTWSGTGSEKNAVLEDISIIRNWSGNNKRPVTIGEYGSIMFADNQSRLTWTNYVRTQFENNGFSWSYFDFGVVFKAYSIVENKWLNGFVEALTGNSAVISDGRSSEGISISPVKASEDDSILVRLFIKMPNSCTETDSVKVAVKGSEIKITTYHKEQIPRGSSINSCIDSVRLGKLASGSYTLVFNSEYIDKVNTLHYSIRDTMNIQISDLDNITDDKSRLLKVYPIPASQFLIVENIKPFNQYRIYDLNGQLKCTGTVGNGRIRISDLRPGEYILHIIEETRTILNKKIIVIQQ